MVTSMEAFRPGDRTDRLAFGQVTWAVLPPAAPATPSQGVTRDGADLFTIASIEESDGSAAIRVARPDILGPGGILHAGALQTLAEHAALRAAREQASPGSAAYTADAAFQFARGAKQGPFIAYPRVLAAAPGLPIDVEVEVRDGDDRLCTLANLRIVLP